MKRDYIALWSILAVAFLLFFCLSTCSDISLGPLHLRSSGMAESLTGKKAADADSTARHDDSVPSNIRIMLDDKPKTVLIIGDSMLEGLSPRLAAYCDASGYTLYSVIWYSSSSELFGQTKLISDYISVLKPDFIFISLGGNELFVKDIAEKRDKYVKEIVSEIGDIPYLWIGPPNWKEDTGINKLIKSDVPEGCFFCSNGMEFERKKDGAHPTMASAALWMDSIVRWMPENAKYYMPLKPYIEPSKKPKRYYIHQPGELTSRPKPQPPSPLRGS